MQPGSSGPHHIIVLIFQPSGFLNLSKITDIHRQLGKDMPIGKS